MAVAAILDLFEPEIAPFDLPSRKPYPRTEHEVDRITRCRDMAIRVSWGICNPHFGEKGRSWGSATAPFERAMVVSYRLSIVTVALCVTIRPQFAIECLQRSNQQGVGDFGPKFRGVPLGADPSCWGCEERTSQANWWWNYFRRISTYVITIHQRHRRTDGQTTCDRNTALCT